MEKFFSSILGIIVLFISFAVQEINLLRVTTKEHLIMKAFLPSESK